MGQRASGLYTILANPAYIEAARKRYGQADVFYCGLVEHKRWLPYTYWIMQCPKPADRGDE